MHNASASADGIRLEIRLVAVINAIDVGNFTRALPLSSVHGLNMLIELMVDVVTVWLVPTTSLLFRKMVDNRLRRLRSQCAGFKLLFDRK